MLKLVVLALFISLEAIAAPRLFEEASLTDHLLMGAPLQNESTGEILALSCSEGTQAKCDRYRFLLGRGQSYFYIGAPFSGSLEDSKTKLKHHIRSVYLLDFIEAPLTRKILSESTSLRMVDDLFHSNQPQSIFSEAMKIPHYKFYYLKHAIESLDQEARSFELRATQIEFLGEASCKIFLSSSIFNRRSHHALQTEERIELLQELLASNEIAHSRFCSLTLDFDQANHRLDVTNVWIGNGFRTDFILKSKDGKMVLESRYFYKTGRNNVVMDKRTSPLH